MNANGCLDLGEASRRLEGLLRHDRLAPEARGDRLKVRTIAGIAYWLPTHGA